MTLTPLDVDNLRLRGALRGYDRGDVDHFRADVIAAIEDYVDQIARLKMRVRELEGELARFREQEEMLKSTVLLAQRTADDLLGAARERAAALLEQAKTEAQQVRRSVADVVAQREQFEYQFHGLLSGFIRRLEQSNPQLGGAPNGRAIAAAEQVSVPMDTTRSPQPDDQDLRIDMEDLTTEPASEVNREDDGEQTVVLPMAQPLLPAQVPGAPRRADRDSAEFSAALDSAAARPGVLSEAQPGNGRTVPETVEEITAESGAHATDTLGEIVDERIRRESDADRPLDYP